MRKLSPQQAMFVQEYLVDFNAAGAARRAGYSAKSAAGQACHMLAQEHIQAAILKERQAREQRLEFTKDAAMQGYIDIFRRCMQRDPEHPDDDFDAAGARASLDSLAKMQGWVVDKAKVQQEVSGPNGGPVDNQLTIRLVRANHADG